ncbi:hypothetical protein SFPGR_27540 [Sulfuriferula plumbiphila]|nr:hypothetical protein SFPGR_27540 [Sulfuriferula plumbiphila]
MPVMTNMAQMMTMVMQRGPVMGECVTLLGNARCISLASFMAQFMPILVNVAYILAHRTLAGMNSLDIVMDVAFCSIGGGKCGDGEQGAKCYQSGFEHCGISCKGVV